MRPAPDDLTELRAALRADVVAVSEALLGPPNKAISSRNTLRWGRKGSFALEIRGPKQGLWRDHGSLEGGDLLSLVCRTHGCDFPVAAAWARHWTGIDAPGPGYTLPPRPAPAQPDNDQVAEEAAERAEKIATAQRIATASVPIAGTIGEYYLKQTRGIAKPEGGWPDAVRWHPGYRAVLAVATTPDGIVQAVQRVHLGEDSSKVTPDEMKRRRLPAVKVTNGPQDGAAVRLPGKLPVLLAEGLETGLAAHSATGHAVLIALGGIGKLDLPPGFTVALADDDPRFSAAAKALRAAVRNWRSQGHDVRLCTPWAARRFDKSDMADVILQHGPVAVQARIARAIDPGSAIMSPVPVAEARTLLGQHITAFVHRAVQSAKPFTQVVKSDTGTGKSHETRLKSVDCIAKLRAKSDARSVGIAVPRHDLADQYAMLLRELSPNTTVEVWRGMERPDPGNPGTTMCQDLDLMKDARAAMLDVDKFACGPCALKAGCAYQRQRKMKPDIIIFPVAMLGHAPPAALRELAVLFIDEDPIDTFLIGNEAHSPITLTLDALNAPIRISGDLSATNKLAGWRRLVLHTLQQAEDGPLQRAAMLAAGLTHDGAMQAHKLEWRTKAEPLFTATMSREERREAMQAMIANRDLGRRAMFWKALAALLADDGPAASGWASLVVLDGDNGPQRAIRLRNRLPIAKGWQVPTLLLDATADPQRLRHIWPDLQVVADIAVATPHMHIRQVTDRAFALSMLDCTEEEPLKPGQKRKARDPAEQKRREKNLRKVHAVICREARRFAPGKTLVVAQLRVRKLLEAMGSLSPTIAWAHHNAVTGLDAWKGVRLMIVVGRTMPSPASVEASAEALTGVAVNALLGWYPRVDTTRQIGADGGMAAAETDRHPDPIAEGFRQQACEGGLVQVIGRSRAVNRGATDPVDVLVMSDVVLPLPVNELIAWDDLDSSPADIMLAEGGIALLNPRDIAAAYPGLWPSWEAAKKALERDQKGTNPKRDILLGVCPLLVRVGYQVAGERRRWVEALVDLAVVPDPRAWLETRLGPLARYELIVPKEEVTTMQDGPLAAAPETELAEQRGLDPILVCRGPVAWDPPAFLLKLSTGRTIKMPASPRPAPTSWLLEPTSPAPDWLADYRPTGPDDGVVWWGPLRPALPTELQALAFEPLDNTLDAAVA